MHAGGVVGGDVRPRHLKSAVVDGFDGEKGWLVRRLVAKGVLFAAPTAYAVSWCVCRQYAAVSVVRLKQAESVMVSRGSSSHVRPSGLKLELRFIIICERPSGQQRGLAPRFFFTCSDETLWLRNVEAWLGCWLCI
jgi:hypothetical protein